MRVWSFSRLVERFRPPVVEPEKLLSGCLLWLFIQYEMIFRDRSEGVLSAFDLAIRHELNLIGYCPTRKLSRLAFLPVEELDPNRGDILSGKRMHRHSRCSPSRASFYFTDSWARRLVTTCRF